MIRIFPIIILIACILVSCMEPTANIEQQDQLAVTMVLNANPMDSLPDILHNLPDSHNWYREKELGIDVSYIVNRIIDKDDSIYVAGDSLNTMIPAQITVSGNEENYTFETGKIERDSITVCYYDEFYYTYYYQFLPYVRDAEWQIRAGNKYSVKVKTRDRNEYTGSTQVPGDFHFIPWEDGNYLKRVDETHWTMRWSPSENGYEYSFYLLGFNDNYTPGRYTESVAGADNDCEVSCPFIFIDIHGNHKIPGIDFPYPNKFFAQVFVSDENLYRYRYLMQDPAGWSNCLGILGSTNQTTVIFEQELE